MLRNTAIFSNDPLPILKRLLDEMFMSILIVNGARQIRKRNRIHVLWSKNIIIRILWRIFLKWNKYIYIVLTLRRRINLFILPGNRKKTSLRLTMRRLVHSGILTTIRRYGKKISKALRSFLKWNLFNFIFENRNNERVASLIHEQKISTVNRANNFWSFGDFAWFSCIIMLSTN